MNFGGTGIFSPLHTVKEMIKENKIKSEPEEGDRIVIRRDRKAY